MLHSFRFVYVAGAVLFFCLTMTVYGQKPAYDGPMSYLSPVGEKIILSGDCSDYTDLSGQPLPIDVIGTTSGATNDYGPIPERPDCWAESPWRSGSGSAPDVTYKWTAPATGRYSISLCGSSYDTVLLLFKFTCPSEPLFPDDFICGNDNNNNYCENSTHSELSYVPLSAGQEVLIVVDGYGSGSGQFHLAISEVQTEPLDLFVENIMDTYHTPGLAACVVKDGEVFWTGTYGWAYIDEVEVTDETIFSLASVSKTLVGTAFMQMWEDEMIGLDNDINEYLLFEVHHPNPAYSDVIITPRMLLTHTSGIRNYDMLQYIVPGDSPIPLGYFLENYLVPGGVYYTSSNWYWNLAPGEECRYSSVGSSLAAYLVEVVADSFPNFCRDGIFEPLGMNESAWFFADFEDSMDIAMPYSWNGSDHVPWGHYGQPNYPGVQLRSSTLQIARFLMAIMQGGEIDGVRILESSTVDMMNTVQFPGIPRFGHPGESGLGWFRLELFDRVMWGHIGRWYGVVTGMFYCPEENTGVIVLSNENFVMNPPFPDGNMLIICELFEFVSSMSPCDYVLGDFNGSGVFNVADIVDGYSKLKTGSPDPAYTCECPYGSGNEWAVAMDVNNSCAFNVADIVDGYSKLKTGSPELEPCEDCPPGSP